MSDNTLYDKLLGAFTWTSFLEPYGSISSESKNVKFLANSVGSVESYNKSLTNAQPTANIDVRNKNYIINDGTPTGIKINSINIISGDTDSKIILIDDKNKSHETELRTSFIDKSDVQLFSNLINNSEGGVLTNISSSSTGRDIGEIISYDKDGGRMDWTSASIAVNNRKVSYGTVYIPSETIGTDPLKNPKSGTQLIQLQNRVSQEQIGTNPREVGTWEPTNRALRKAKNNTKLQKGITFNSRAGNTEDVFRSDATNDYTFKIGDVVLKVPPTHVTVTELRSADSVEVLNFIPMDTANPVSRIAIKINAVFSGKNQIDGDLKRLITQFKYVPFNIIHSLDLVNILGSEDSFIAQMNQSTVQFIPVTMDEYTLYTIEGHPNSIGCTMQFSLFNYLAYFDGDKHESFQYEAAQFDDKGVLVIPSGNEVRKTTHLENAIHPYNFDIEDILSREDKRFFKLNDLGGVGLNQDYHVESGSYARLYKLTAFQDVNMKIVNKDNHDPLSEIRLLCNSISIKYENIFAWHQIIGYPHACAQYIGPGLTTAAINAKASLDEIDDISRLFKTYQEFRSKDYNAVYDDRYIISSSLTDFADCNVISIADVATTSLPQHPGFMDINLIFKRSPYLSNATADNNKVAEQDFFWGMSRVSRAIENNPALLKVLQDEEKKRIEIINDTYGYVARWAANTKNGDPSIAQSLSVPLSNLINKAVASIVTEEKAKNNEEYANNLFLNSIEIADMTGGVNLKDYCNFLTKSWAELSMFTQNPSISSSEIGFSEPDSAKFPTSDKALYASAATIQLINSSKEGFLVWKKFFLTLFEEFPNIFTLSALKGNQSSTKLDEAKVMLSSLSLPGNTEKHNKTASLINNLLGVIRPDYDFTRKSLDEIKADLDIQHSSFMVIVNYETVNKYKLDKEKVKLTIQDLVSRINNNNVAIFGISANASSNDDASVIHFWQDMKEGGIKYKNVAIEKTKINIDKINKDIEEQIKHLNSFPPPYAAHRYYPMCDSMISLDVRFSVSVGSYYYNRMQDTTSHFIGMISRMKAGLSNSISPAFDFKAWKNIYPNKSKSSEYVQNAIDGKDPFWLMQAISYPESKKDIVTYKSQENVDYTFSSPLINMAGASTAESLRDSNSDNNKPFSGLSDWMFLDSVNGGNVYGSPGLRNIREAIINKNKLCLDDAGAGGPKGTPKEGDQTAGGGAITYTKIYDAGFHNNALQIGNNLKRRSETTTGAMSGMFIGSEEKGLTEFTEDITRYNSRLFAYLTKVGSAYKDPSSVLQAYPVPKDTPTNPSNNENTQELKKTDMVKLRSSLISTCRFLISNTLHKNIVLADKLTDIIIGYCNAKMQSSAYPSDIIQIASTAIKSAINTTLFSVKQETIRTSLTALQLDDSEVPMVFEFRQIEALDQSRFMNTSINGVEWTPGSKIYGHAANFYKHIYDATLLYLNLCILRTIKSLKDADSVRNPFLASVYMESSNEGTMVEQNYNNNTHSYQRQLLAMEVPNIIHNEVSLTQVLEETIKEIRTNSSEYKNIIATAEKLRTSFDKFLISSKLNDEILGEAYSDAVSEQTAGALINQFMQSMLPTVGMENAFPTYKMYIIDSNLSDIRFHSMDNWYDFRLVKDVMVIKSKEDPSHLLRARVVIDERFIVTTTTFVQRDSDRNPIEWTNKLANIDKLNTSFDHAFYQGKVPLRVGMRLCLKLGYHTDPRMLDTVFIGTITSLQGTMDKFVFELEANGDGRELSVPSTNTSEEISGLNYGEVITKVLRSNPSVFHLGRNYGTAIEKFTREHYLTYAFAKSCVDGALRDAAAIRNIIINGTDTNIKMTGLAGVGMALTGVSMSGIGLAIGAGTLVATPFMISRMFRKLRNDGVTGLAWNEASEFIDKKFTGFNSNGSVFTISNYFYGHTFDNAKASGQIARHLYEIYKYGHDPIDQNIWAVDIWQRGLTNIADGISVNINNKISLWDLLHDIKRVYPNYAIDVRPYGGRSTLYFGPLNWLMFRTDDPVLAMATNLAENSNPSVINQASDTLKDLYDTDAFYNNQGNPFPNLTEFQKTHFASSDSNIIFNGIQSTPNRGWNAVAVNCGKETYQTTANAELHPSVIRTVVKELTWTNKSDVAQQYALGLLKEGVEKMYGGTLALRGNPRIEPYDRIYIMDAINKMYGWIEVETVIHKFDMNSGFTTHITPNLVCSINSDAYKTTSQIIRSILFKEDIASYVFKTLAGIGVGLAIGTIGGPIELVAGIIGGATLLYSGATTLTESIKKTSEILGNASQYEQEETTDYQSYLHDAVLSAVGADSYVHGMYGGFVLSYIISMAKQIKSGDALPKMKSMSVEMWEAIKNKWESTYYGKGGLGKYITAKGNEGANVAYMIQKLAKNINKLSGGESSIKLKDIQEKGVDFLREEELINAKATLESARADYETSVKEKFPDGDKASKLMDDFDKKMKAIEKELETVKKNVQKTGATQAKVPISGKALTKTKASIEIAKGIKGMFTMSTISAVIDVIEAFPRWFEQYTVNYMSKANCITISPLYSKNVLMIAGLDGWQYTNAFMHLKGLVLNAKKVLSNADIAFKFSLPNQIYSKELIEKINSLKDATDSKRTAKSKAAVTKAGKVSAEYLPMINKAVENAKSLIHDPCGKEILTPEFIASIIQNESSWNYNAGKITHATSGGLGLMQLVPTWRAQDFYDAAKKAGRVDITNKLDETGFVGTKNSTGDFKGGYKINNRAVWVDVLTDPNNVDINIQAGTNFVADLINDEIKKNGCKGRSKNDIISAVARNYNGDTNLSSTGSQIRNDYARNVVNNINSQKQAIEAINAGLLTNMVKPLTNTIFGNIDVPQQINSSIFKMMKLSSIYNANENSSAVSGFVQTLKNGISDISKQVVVKTLNGAFLNTITNAAAGDLLVATQTSSNGIASTVIYKIASKTGTQMIVTDSSDNKITITNSGRGDTWTMQLAGKTIPYKITPTSIIKSKSNIETNISVNQPTNSNAVRG